MSDTSTFASANGEPQVEAARRTAGVLPPGAAEAAPDADLQRLRELLFSREMALLKALEKRLNDPIQHTRETSDVIAEALLMRAQKDDAMLYSALEPMSEKLFREALRKSPMDFVNVLFPIMGPAIRRSIAESFHSMLESFHKTMGQVFSWKGLRWRWEALRTGMSFSDVVLMHTLLYRVEQVFFIHAETGLVLSHVVNEGAASQDADMVSAMLTAIQDFARDCFASEPHESNLDSLRMGDFTILLERGAAAYLACVVRGTVPLDFRRRLRDAMAVLDVKYADEMAAFTGDTEKFESARWVLENLLDARFADEDAPLPLWVRLLPVLLVLLLLAGGAYWWHEAHERDLARQAVEHGFAQVGKEPGIMLVEARRGKDGRWDVIYQRDAFAKEPRSLLDAKGIDPQIYNLRVIPYVSYEPDMVTQRVMERIAPPAGVNVELGRDGTLYLRGRAPMAWILQARQDALGLPGVEKIDVSGLIDPRVDELKRKIALVETTVVEFPLGKDAPVPEDESKLAAAVDTLVDIEKLAAQMNVAVSLTVYGHADATGNEKRNYEISQARARTIAALLYARGSSIPIAMYGMGSEYAAKNAPETVAPSGKRAGADAFVEPAAARRAPGERGDQSSRKIELRVHLAQLPTDFSVPGLLQ
ncbi:MAG: OmpA family protein [Candidatus Accumulibacter sp.]|jgi:OOP family OmpA-OmpF porin|nr:OmpA family protein [Accumulibacter sp.]